MCLYYIQEEPIDNEIMRFLPYEAKLESSLTCFPQELCVMADGAEVEACPDKLPEIARWVAALPQIKRLIFHISTTEPEKTVIDIKNLPGTVRFVNGSTDETSGCGNPEIIIAVGKSGREEICEAVASLAKEGVSSDEVDEAAIERHLRFKVSPDFVIKTGGSHLTDFLIWQSVYSELFFTDVNWNRFRRVDFLRALRDFQSRERRFGK